MAPHRSDSRFPGSDGCHPPGRVDPLRACVLLPSPRVAEDVRQAARLDLDLTMHGARDSSRVTDGAIVRLPGILDFAPQITRNGSPQRRRVLHVLTLYQGFVPMTVKVTSSPPRRLGIAGAPPIRLNHRGIWRGFIPPRFTARVSRTVRKTRS